jgi:hypothetical protein
MESKDFARIEFTGCGGRFQVYSGKYLLERGLDSICIMRKRTTSGTPFQEKKGAIKKFLLPKGLDVNAQKRMRQKIRRSEKREIKQKCIFPKINGVVILPPDEIKKLVYPYRVYIRYRKFYHYSKCFQPAPVRAMRRVTFDTIKRYTKHPYIVNEICNISRALVSLGVSTHPYRMGDLAVSFYIAYRVPLKKWWDFWVVSKGLNQENPEVVDKEFPYHGFIPMEKFKARYGRLQTDALLMSVDEKWVLPIPLWHDIKNKTENKIYSYDILNYYGIPGYTKLKFLE